MNNNRNGHSTPVVVFGAGLLLAILAVAVMTFERADTRITRNETQLVTTGMAKSNQLLDRTVGPPVKGN
jgi:hypothetical protein